MPNEEKDDQPSGEPTDEAEIPKTKPSGDSPEDSPVDQQQETPKVEEPSPGEASADGQGQQQQEPSQVEEPSPGEGPVDIQEQQQEPLQVEESPPSPPGVVPSDVQGLQQQETSPAKETPPVEGGEDDFSIFDSQADLEEIFSAMEDVKKDEANAIATAVQAIESGQDAQTALQSLSSEVAEKIQKQLEERSAAEEEHFVTEEEFIKHAKSSLSKTWYHCLYFLAFKSESGIASKKVLYEALKETLSNSPVDVMPEHMFNFGLSTLIKVQLYEKPVVLFKRGGEFRLDVNRKKLQDLLKLIGRPLSKRPVVTKKEEKKMITDFFSDDFL